MEAALAGVRVVDLAQGIAGAYCTKLLAGFGAEVLAVEPLEGSALRAIGPHVKGADGRERGVPFLWLGTGKRSLALDLEAEGGRELLERLATGADVVVLEAPEGGRLPQGLDGAMLRAAAPRAVVLVIEDFGDGPYRDWRAGEMQLQAISGMMHMTGGAQAPPLASGPAVARYSAGLNAYDAVLMALFQRGNQTEGEGQLVELSVMEAAIENVENAVAGHLLSGKVARRGGHAFAPWGLYEGADGHVAVVGAPFRNWNEGSQLFDEPRLKDAKFAHVTGRVAHHHELDDLLKPWLARHPVRETFHEAQARGMAFGYAAPLAEAFESPQHDARDFFVEVDGGSAGAYRICDAPYRMGATPWRTSRAPEPGEHTAAVLEHLGCSDDEVDGLRAAGVVR